MRVHIKTSSWLYLRSRRQEWCKLVVISRESWLPVVNWPRHPLSIRPIFRFSLVVSFPVLLRTMIEEVWDYVGEKWEHIDHSVSQSLPPLSPPLSPPPSSPVPCHPTKFRDPFVFSNQVRETISFFRKLYERERSWPNPDVMKLDEPVHFVHSY